MRSSQDNERKSPLKEKPLRVPGQSGDEMLDEKRDRLDEYVGMTIAFLVIAFWEWWHSWFKVPPQPWPATALVVIVILMTLRKAFQYKKEAKQIKQGRDGERIVAEQLEKLRAHGYRALHDLAGGDFNVDHVLIGPAGVFVIETKTPSKVGRNNQIQFDGCTIFMRGQPYPENPVKQAKGNAVWLNEVLKNSTGKSLWVMPIVVFPDWDVRSAKVNDILVLSHKEIESGVTSRPKKLTDDEISMATFHLERFVRSSKI
jgi:hypothetical protein